MRRKGKKYKSFYNYRKKYIKGKSIIERPEYINNRSEFGHFEADSILSSRDGKGSVFSLVERKTRFFIGKVTSQGTANNFVEFIKSVQKKYGNVIKSITVDNGTEFSGWEELEELGIAIYFSRPYNPNDKGTVEHVNGKVREFFGKKTDFSEITQRILYNQAIRVINNRPRKVLSWISSREAFFSELNQLKSQAA